MKLVVVAGDREYLAPWPIPSDHLLRVLRRIDEDAHLPEFAWAAAAAGSPAPAFPAHALAVEYACDTTPSRSTAFVVLPFESPWGARRDARVQAFLEAAEGAVGKPAVGCIHLCLSRNTQAVLQHLDRAQGRRDGAGRPSIEIVPLLSDGSEDDHETIEAFQRNYTEAVLERGQAIVGERGIFTGRGRAAVVARCLAENRLLLRIDLAPERVLAELAPGGELFELLARPLARPAEGGTLSTAARRIAKE